MTIDPSTLLLIAAPIAFYALYLSFLRDTM